jgi:hypothetical protein
MGLCITWRTLTLTIATKAIWDPAELTLLMGGPGGPGGPRPPGGGVTGAAPPLRGVAEDRRSGARGSLPPTGEASEVFTFSAKVNTILFNR